MKNFKNLLDFNSRECGVIERKIYTMTETIKKRIDDMDYESMLSLWRNAPIGHPMFQGEIGKYFSEVMAKKRDEVGNDAHVAASKSIGWNG